MPLKPPAPILNNPRPGVEREERKGKSTRAGASSPFSQLLSPDVNPAFAPVTIDAVLGLLLLLLTGSLLESRRACCRASCAMIIHNSVCRDRSCGPASTRYGKTECHDSSYTERNYQWSIQRRCYEMIMFICLLLRGRKSSRIDSLVSDCIHT